MHQMQLPDMPDYPVVHTEGALCTIWHNPETGYREGRIVQWGPGGAREDVVAEDLGPFDVDDLVEQYRTRLRRLGF